MGQAKQRGAFDERKASAIHDAELAKQILLKHEKDWWDSLSSEEQKRIISNRVGQLSLFKK
jgi:hypothetical protein